MPEFPEEIEVWEEGKIGEVLKTIRMPKVRDKVRVNDLTTLANIFGDEIPLQDGVVAKVFHPEDPENIWELEHGWAVQVTWTPRAISRAGNIKKTADLWAFDVTELTIVG